MVALGGFLAVYHPLIGTRLCPTCVIMPEPEHPWEIIYQQDKWPQRDPVPLFHEVVPLLQSRNCHRLLDLGCGNGNYLVPFAKIGFDMTGADIAPTGLNLSRRRLASATLPGSLVQCDFQRPLPFRKNSFEAIWSIQSIHHARIDQIRLTIQELWRVLTPNGFMIVTVAAGLDDEYLYQEVEPGTYIPLEGPERGLPHHLFTEAEVRKEFQLFAIEAVYARLNGKILVILASK
ncbi:MAG: class I SAM-dependent methyltransferase [Chloroflexota bacterium]